MHADTLRQQWGSICVNLALAEGETDMRVGKARAWRVAPAAIRWSGHAGSHATGAAGVSKPWHHRPAMPETTFLIPALRTQADADAVMFELQDLPCVHQADVDLAAQTAWVSHSGMISAEDIAVKLQAAGYDGRVDDGWASD